MHPVFQEDELTLIVAGVRLDAVTPSAPFFGWEGGGLRLRAREGNFRGTMRTKKPPKGGAAPIFLPA